MALLVPNPARRMSVEQAMSHPWLAGGWPGDSPGTGGAPSGAVLSRPLSSGALSGGPLPNGAEFSGTQSGVSGGAPGEAPTGVTTDEAFLTRDRGGSAAVSSVAQRLSSVCTVKEEGIHFPSMLAPPAPPPKRQPKVKETTPGGEGGEGGEEEGGKREAKEKQKGSSGWRRWRADLSPGDLLSCGSVPSTTSFP